MNKEDVKFILGKNARVMYVDQSSTMDELNQISKYMRQFNPGYESFRQAIIASVTRDLHLALEYCEEALNFGYVNNDVYLIQEISMFMGVLNRSLGLTEDSLKNYITALKFGEQPRIFNNIADIYLTIGDFSEARIYLKKALNVLNSKGELDLFDNRLLNIVYTNMSEAELKSGKIEEGIKSAQKCIEIGNELNDVFTTAFGYSLLATGAMLKEDYQLALDYVDKSQILYAGCDTFSQNRVFDYIQENTRLEAKCLNKWGKYQQSNDKISTLRNYVKQDYLLIISNYDLMNDTENLSKYYRKYLEFSKRKEKFQRNNKIDHFKSKMKVFETEKKANDYELLYNHTKSVSSIGRDIIAAEKLDEVLISLHAHIDKLMDFNSLALARVDDKSIDYNWVMENNERIDSFSVDISSKNSFSSWVVRNKKSIRLNDALTEDELKQYKEEAGTVVYGHAMDSMILAPIMYKDKVYGVINIQSATSYTYTEYDLEVINMLASFIAIAMKNWQDTKLLRIANEKLELLSKTDALTGVSNRHVLSEIVGDLFKLKNDEDNIISVIMIDIDHFKEYNDTYGHIDGDRCIVKIVESLRKYLDTGNFRLFRYGGDEFAAIVPFITPDEVKSILEKARRDIESLMIENKKSKVSEFVTCSFGFTTVKKGVEYQRAFYLADEALYMAKAGGKNRVEFIEE